MKPIRIENYSANLMFDVVSAVLKLQGTVRIRDKKGDANYNGVHTYLYKNDVRVSIETVVNYLRLAEQKGYIQGHSQFYNRSGGGAKRWHFVKWPPYPYYELMEGYNGNCL